MKPDVIPPDPDPDAEPVPEETPGQTLNREFGEQREAKAVLEIAELIDTVSEMEGQVSFKREDIIKQTLYFLERLSVDVVKPDINEFVRNRYGGGRYHAFFYVPKAGSNGYEQMTKRIIDIDPAIPSGQFFKQLEEKTKPPGDDGAMSKLIDKMRAEGGSNSELIVAMMQMQAQQSRDTLQMIMQTNNTMMTAMTNMVAALKGGGGGGGSAAIDMLQVLKVFKELSGGGNTTDPMKLLEFAHKLSKEMSDKGEDEPTWLKALETFLPTLLGSMSQRQQLAAPPASPERRVEAVAPPAPNPFEKPANVVNMETAPPTTNNQPQEPVSIVDIIRNSLPVIFAKIKQGCTPQDVLDWINNPVMADVFTDEQYDELVALMKKDDWVTVLFGDAKVIEPHRAWFDELRDLLRKEDGEAETQNDKGTVS